MQWHSVIGDTAYQERRRRSFAELSRSCRNLEEEDLQAYAGRPGYFGVAPEVRRRTFLLETEWLPFDGLMDMRWQVLKARLLTALYAADPANSAAGARYKEKIRAMEAAGEKLSRELHIETTFFRRCGKIAELQEKKHSDVRREKEFLFIRLNDLFTFAPWPFLSEELQRECLDFQRQLDAYLRKAEEWGRLEELALASL